MIGSFEDLRILGVDIQKVKTSVKVSPFKMDHVPHLADFLDMDWSKTETVTIYKGQSCGCTQSIIDIPSFYMPKELDIYMNKLKQKYPDWRG
jgi:hypothetical protein